MGLGSAYVYAWVSEKKTVNHSLTAYTLIFKQVLPELCQMPMTELADIAGLVRWVDLCALCHPPSSVFTAWTCRGNRTEVLGSRVLFENKMWEISLQRFFNVCCASLKTQELLFGLSLNNLKASGAECWSQITFKKLFSGDVWDTL